MNNNFLVFKNLEFFGEKYRERYLNNPRPETLMNNWWEALKFFFMRSFVRGRADKLSLLYYSFVERTLQELFSISNSNLEDSFNDLKKYAVYFDKTDLYKIKQDKIMRGKQLLNSEEAKRIINTNPFIKELSTQRKISAELNGIKYENIARLDNEYDIFMVLDVLKFITSDDDKKNIYSYLLSSIKINGVKFIYDLLCSSKFYAISDKIASLIIRDILLLNQELKVSPNDYACAFPVDIWVKRIAAMLGCIESSNFKIKEYFISNCAKYNINPLKVAAGSWFLGFNMLDIIIENILGKIDIGRYQ